MEGNYFSIVDGVAHDWVLTDMNDNYGKFFYLGKIFIGYLFKIREHSWSAVACGQGPHGPRIVRGFGSAEDGAIYLVEILDDKLRCELKKNHQQHEDVPKSNNN